ncbi:sulfatase [Flammeovirga kamogawensis]|nr:sulfatase [Flammeovirga kamogawensis]
MGRLHLLNSNSIFFDFTDMNRLLITILFCSFLFVHDNYAQKKKDKPNILFIMCDDLNDYQGVFGGHPQAKTPNIDKLAKSGTRFLNAQSNIPVCQPSRNSLFTGVYPSASSDFGWTPHLKQKVLKHNKTFVQVLKENGYYTLASGKLMHANEKEVWNEWGLDIKHNYGPFYYNGDKLAAHPSVPAPFNKIGPIDGSYGRISEMPNHNGERGVPGLVEGWNMKPVKYNSDSDRDLLYDEKHAEWAVNKFKEFANTKTEKPFFMGIGFVRPHTPLHAPDKYFDMFPLDKIELDKWTADDTDDIYYQEIFGTKGKGSRYYRDLLSSYNGDRELALKTFLQAYLACVAFVDAQIGTVLEGLEASGLADNTVVIFTSDHGWQMGEKELLFKNTVYEEATRIPYVIRDPKAKKNQVVTHPVSLVDLYPTVLDFAGIEASNLKAEGGAELGGYSVIPFIENPKTKKWEGPEGALSVKGVWGAVSKNFKVNEQNYSYRTEKWRYIHYTDGKEELYNHFTDPYEWKNVASDKKYAEVKADLKAQMETIIKVKFNDIVN